ncbi:hypothetical protein NQ317_015905 [Molorchus minor]|uniref:Uncharacterized protein n=1 Tax=Molorchus minor TaxID=1323400 RepID=A0ABQ9J2P7_9CUCU|nr:hypothetical protein NQ317_015905 [Molorchus minor]
MKSVPTYTNVSFLWWHTLMLDEHFGLQDYNSFYSYHERPTNMKCKYYLEDVEMTYETYPQSGAFSIKSRFLSTRIGIVIVVINNIACNGYSSRYFLVKP